MTKLNAMMRSKRGSPGKGDQVAVETGRRRLRSEDRKRQIVEVTLRIIAEYGVKGTTVTRIGDTVGIVHSGLYAHFANREEILLAALDAIFEEIFEIHRSSAREDAVEYLREIMRRHTTALTPNVESSYTLPLFQFIAASSDRAIGEALEKKQIEANREIAGIIDKAKRQGTVKQSVDSEEAAWMLTACAWAEETAYLAGIDMFQERRLASRMADLMLESILT
jgi:AcrR family transcriptional regulator